MELGKERQWRDKKRIDTEKWNDILKKEINVFLNMEGIKMNQMI